MQSLQSKLSHTTHSAQLIDNFDVLGVPDELLRGIYAYGFEAPSLVQQTATPAIIAGKDVLYQAPSGTGKTART